MMWIHRQQQRKRQALPNLHVVACRKFPFYSCGNYLISIFVLSLFQLWLVVVVECQPTLLPPSTTTATPPISQYDHPATNDRGDDKNNEYYVGIASHDMYVYTYVIDYVFALLIRTFYKIISIRCNNMNIKNNSYFSLV
jgi:hypothetical protein